MRTTNQPDLILSHLILAVMGLRNKYKYDTVAPQALNDEIDVAYNEALARLEALIAAERRIKGITCPAYNSHDTIFIGSGGYLTCSWIECPEPELDAAIKSLTPQAKAGQA